MPATGFATIGFVGVGDGQWVGDLFEEGGRDRN